MSHQISSVAVYSTTPYYLLSDGPNRFAHNVCNESMIGSLNYIWLTPLNIATNLAAMALSPLMSLVDLIAAALFASIACCCSNSREQARWYRSAEHCALVAWDLCTRAELVMFARILNVNACHGYFRRN